MKISNCYMRYKTGSFILDVKELNLEEGKINCILGDNGSGKSTLLKNIMNNNCEHEIRSKMMLLQKPYIYTGSVLDNINIVRKLAPVSKINVEKLLTDLQLDGLLTQRARSLSGGQRQRLAFALVMISDAELTILDEPFNNIDVRSQRLMVDVMMEYKRTYLLVSHKLNLSRKIGEFFVLMENGKIIDEGDHSIFDRNETLKLIMEME